MKIKTSISGSFKNKLLVFAYFAIPFFALYPVYIIVINSILENKLDKIRKAGYPTSTEELDKFYTKIPDSENAAIIYEEAFANYQNNQPDTDTTIMVAR